MTADVLDEERIAEEMRLLTEPDGGDLVEQLRKRGFFRHEAPE